MDELDIFALVRQFDALLYLMSKYRLCVTKKGFLGLVDPGAYLGAEVCVVHGCCTPLILRPGGERTWQRLLVCDAFVLGLMNGEALDMEDVALEEIVLR